MKNNINKRISIVLIIVFFVMIISMLFQTSKNSIKISINLENLATTEYMIGKDNINNINSEYNETNKEWPQGVNFKSYINENKEYKLVLHSNNAGEKSEYISNDGELIIYNLIPQKEYNFELYEKHDDNYNLQNSGIINTQGSLRWIRATSIHNLRDLGGWPTTDGHKVKYGVMYRGSEMNEHFTISQNDKILLNDTLGVTCDLDFRETKEAGNIMVSPIGDKINYVRIPIKSYLDYVKNPGNSISCIMKTILSNDVIYMHCWGGCDRTGTISFLLLGLLGVPEEELAKDYELSTFSVFGDRIINDGIFDYSGLQDYIYSIQGDTLQEKIFSWFINNGVSKNEIEQFLHKMLN